MEHKLPKPEFGLSIWIVTGTHWYPGGCTPWQIKVAHKGPAKEVKEEWDADSVLFERNVDGAITPGYITKIY